MNKLVDEITILIVFVIAFFISFNLQDYTFNYKVNKIIKANPNITLKEFMDYEDNIIEERN